MTTHGTAGTGGSVADKLSVAHFFLTLSEWAKDLGKALVDALRGVDKDGDAIPSPEESDNLSEATQRKLRDFMGTDEGTAAVLHWIRWGLRVLGRVARSNAPTAEEAVEARAFIRLQDPGQLHQLALQLVDAEREGGEVAMAEAMIDFADITSEVDPRTGMLRKFARWAKRSSDRMLLALEALPSVLSPVVHVAARTFAWTVTALTVLMVVWVGVTFWVTMKVMAAGVADNWRVVGVYSVFGYTLSTILIFKAVAQVIALGEGLWSMPERVLHGVLSAIGVGVKDVNEHNRADLSEKINDLAGSFIVPAAVGLPSWWLVSQFLSPDRALGATLMAALGGAGISWLLHANEHDTYAPRIELRRRAIIGVVVTVVLGTIVLLLTESHALPGQVSAVVPGKPDGRQAVQGLVAFTVAKTVKEVGEGWDYAAAGGAYGLVLGVVVVIAIVALISALCEKKYWWALAIGVAAALGAAQIDREVAMSPIPSGVSAEERALEAAEVASMEREEAAAQAVVYHRSPISPRAQAQREAAIARAMEAAVQTGIAMERERNRSAQPTR